MSADALITVASFSSLAISAVALADAIRTRISLKRGLLERGREPVGDRMLRELNAEHLADRRRGTASQDSSSTCLMGTGSAPASGSQASTSMCVGVEK